MTDEKAMADKILRTLENIINSDSELQEFIIIPTEGNARNKSPILYEQHNIGLESWCVKHVYQYACSILFDHRELFRKKKSYSKMDNINYLLIGAILINPEVGTFWNMKRDLMELDVLTIDQELHFSKIVLSYKSKSNEAFSYRRWLLKRVIDKVTVNDLRTPLSLLQNELMVIDMASQKSPNNYHSWNHRIWCMENLSVNNANLSNIVLSELSYSQEWINSHVSEHVGYHYRQYLIKLVKKHKNMSCLLEPFYDFVIKHLNLINDGEYSNLLIYLLGKQTKTRLVEETYSYINYISLLLYDLFVLIDKLNKFLPEHESLFYHRRFVVFHLLKLVHDYHGVEFQLRSKVIESTNSIVYGKNIISSDIIGVKNLKNDTDRNQWPKLFKPPLNKLETGNLYKILINAEKDFVSENLANNYSAVQNELTKRYQKWIKYVIGFE